MNIGPVAVGGLGSVSLNDRGQVAGASLVNLGRRIGPHYRAFFWDPAERRPRQRYLWRNERLGFDCWATGITNASPPVMRLAVLTSNLKASAWNGNEIAIPWARVTYWRERIIRSLRVSDTGWVLAHVDDGEYQNPKIIRWNPIAAMVEQFTLPSAAVSSGSLGGINDLGDALVFRGEKLAFWGRDGAEIEIWDRCEASWVSHLSLNNRGEVLIGYQDGSTFRTLLWTREDGTHELRVEGDPGVSPREITRHGVVLLHVGSAPETTRAVLWRDGDGNRQSAPEEFTDLTPPGATSSAALDINGEESPQVLLTAVLPSGERHTYFWENGRSRQLPNLFPRRARDGRLLSLNDRGQLLGIARIGREWRGYLVSPSTLSRDR